MIVKIYRQKYLLKFPEFAKNNRKLKLGLIMNYKYLQEWASKATPDNLIFKEISRYTDQYVIRFKRSKVNLFISLASEDSFLFWGDKSRLPFKIGGELRQFNDNLVNSKLDEISISEVDRIVNLHFSKIDIYNKEFGWY